MSSNKDESKGNIVSNEVQTVPKSPEPKFFVIDDKMYNSKGYQICGFLNAQNYPCQRIGKCPFHVGKSKTKPDKYPSCVSLLPSKTELKKKPFRKGWTQDEHVRFLVGLKLYGRGNWREIATVVKTRTPLQTQSHAQKYFQRQNNTGSNVRRKKSIHDATLSDIDEQTMLHYTQKLGKGHPILSITKKPGEVPAPPNKTNDQFRFVAPFQPVFQVPYQAMPSSALPGFFPLAQMSSYVQGQRVAQPNLLLNSISNVSGSKRTVPVGSKPIKMPIQNRAIRPSNNNNRFVPLPKQLLVPKQVVADKNPETVKKKKKKRKKRFDIPSFNQLNESIIQNESVLTKRGREEESETISEELPDSKRRKLK